MKQIVLKTLTTDEGKILDYKSTLIDVCRTHPQGIRVTEMEKAVRVLGRLRSANGIVKLEDADWETLCTYIENFPFVLADEAIIQMRDDVKNAQVVEVK